MPHEGEEEEDRGADDMEVDPNETDFAMELSSASRWRMAIT